MPGMDGPATLKVLRDSGELTGIPVLFLTARVQGADYRLLNELGAKAVLRKPFDPLTLADEIASVLGWS